LRRRKRELEGEKVVGTEALPSGEQAIQATDQEPCADEQNGGESDLRNQQDFAAAIGVGSGAQSAAGFFQGAIEIEPGGLKRRI
jgi:hypothetical protein